MAVVALSVGCRRMSASDGQRSQSPPASEALYSKKFAQSDFNPAERALQNRPSTEEVGVK